MLALDLVRSWSFERPSAPELFPSTIYAAPPSPTRERHTSLFARQPSVYIDMDLPSAGTTHAAPTRPGSPTQQVAVPSLLDPDRDVTQIEEDAIARKAGIGSLMKSAKRDVQVPEFDMGAFF
jgi:hypothetical protein